MASVRSTPPTSIPERTSSQRKAWPLILKVKAPGSTAFSEIPILQRTSWELQRKSSRRSTTRTPLSRSIPPHIFDQLPTQVYHCILEQLVSSHVQEVMVDAVGLLRDLTNCCLVSKRWLHPAREHLYFNVWLLHNEISKRRKRLSLSRHKNRLELLGRTLTEERSIAHLVHYITVTPTLWRELNAPKSLLSRSPYALDMLMQIMELCPQLESIDGFVPELSPQNAQYFQTLLRRPKLRNLLWWTHPGSWFLVDVDRLSAYKDCWQNLDTLVLSQGEPSKSMTINGRSILTLLAHTPSLTSLMLAGLCTEDVNDELLKSLPPLQRLRLEALKGVSDRGIDALSEGAMALSLRSLTLSGLQIKSMSTVVSLLDSCDLLRRFKLVQMEAPQWEADSMHMLSSQSLQYLHWETLLPGDSTKHIAKSIEKGKFPRLTQIKVPCDNDSQLQALCRPIQEVELTEDDHKFMDTGRLHDSSYSMRLAQLRAQLRIQEARRDPSFSFVVNDEDDTTQHTDTIGAYLGRMDSQIEYCLEPDIPGTTVALAQLSAYQQPADPGLATMSTLSVEVASFPAYSYDLLF